MTFTLPDAVGMLGVAIVLGLYWAAHADRLSTRSPVFSLGNALGAGLILVSLYFDFNWPAFIIESAWVLISLWGFSKHRQSSAA